MIRLSKSCIGEAEKKAVMSVLEREFLGMGTEVEHFEKMLTNLFVRPVLCVVNGTAALHLALQAVGIGGGDEVLVQSLTYVASFQAISATGAKPVPCDIDPNTLCLDWRDAERKVTPKTKAVMPVHYAGGVGALDEIYAFAERHNLRVIEDAAHAFGTVYREEKVGGFGDIACFSFDGIKNITSGEGGCIVANDEQVLNKIRDIRLLGVEKDTEKRYLGERSWTFDVNHQGWRYHMSNIMAAIGIEQLKRAEEFAKKRRAFAKLYDELLSDVDGISTLRLNYEKVVPHIYVIKLHPKINRNNLQIDMLKNGVQTGLHYQPNHWLSKYKVKSAIDIVERTYSRLLTLPLHPDMTEDNIVEVVEVLKRNMHFE